MRKQESLGPICNHFRIIMTEAMEKDTSLLFAAIVNEMVKKRIPGAQRALFMRAYFRAKETGHDKIMDLFNAWVRLQREVPKP